MTKKDTQFIICCQHRGTYFIAIHGFTPMYGEKSKARKFKLFSDAWRYALDELFTSSAGFTIESIEN
jgi:hypothetical protein